MGKEGHLSGREGTTVLAMEKGASASWGARDAGSRGVAMGGEHPLVVEHGSDLPLRLHTSE